MENYTITTTIDKNGKIRRIFTLEKVAKDYDRKTKTYKTLGEVGWTITSLKYDAENNLFVTVRVGNTYLYLSENKNGGISIDSKPTSYNGWTELTTNLKKNNKNDLFKNAKTYLLSLPGFKKMAWTDFVELAESEKARQEAEAKAKAELVAQAKAEQEKRVQEALKNVNVA